MKKTFRPVIAAFMERKARHIGNTSTDGTYLYLFDNCIARWQGEKIEITNAHWFTVTTRDRLNGIPSVRIHQKNYQWFLYDKAWDGDWATVDLSKASEYEYRELNLKV